MKQSIYILLLPALLVLGGCEKLDRELITNITEKQITQSFQYTSYRAASLYTDLPEGFLYIDRAMMASATDEAEHFSETSAIQKFNNGSINSYDNPDNAWVKYYRAIRKANLFLASADSINLDTYKLDPNPSSQSIYQTRMSDIKRWKYEARFLRAFYYFELVKRYGGVPLFTSVLPATGSYADVKRNTLKECIQFISDECDSAAGGLLLTYAQVDLGRATKGAALALKSRTLLYAASELFSNPSWAAGYAHPELISLTGDRTARWTAAADAAKAVIDLAGTGYTLNGNYRSLFNGFNIPEIISTFRNGASNQFEKANYSPGFDLGETGTMPSQNLVDAYEMTDGSKFDWSNPTHAANPYANRDPRLTMSIITNASMYKNRKMEIWAGGRDGKGLERATRTGYYLKKYLSEFSDITVNATSIHSWILLRLPEMYLNYAEALNEYDPGNGDIKKYVDMVRARAGVNMPGIPGGLSQDDMRERIRNERRVEFAFEDHRSWDVRRWLQGPAYLGSPLRGVDIKENPDGSFLYTPIVVEQRVFQPKMYLYPIPQGEINITKGLVQNPLW